MQETVQLPPTKSLHAAGQAGVDHVAVDGVQHNDGVVIHAQRGGGVDPEAVPAAAAQLGVHALGVVAALGGDNNGKLGQRVNIKGVLELAGVAGACNRGGLAAGVGGGEEDGVDIAEVAFVLHALHQDGTDHAAPANQADGRNTVIGHEAQFSGAGQIG